MTVRLALLTEIPAPFRIPLFNALAAEEGIDLRVLFLGTRDPKRPYPLYVEEFAFEWEVLKGRDLLREPRWVVANTGTGRALRRFRPDVVLLGGWNQPAFWHAALHALLWRRRLVVWVESTARDARSGFALYELAKRGLVRACSAAVVPGRASAHYVCELGLPEDRIAVAPNAVDQELFSSRVDELRVERDRLREELGIDGVCMLYVGRLDPEKGVDILLEAVRSLPAELVIGSGGGSDEQRLRATAPPNARFVGWLDRDALARWYAAADALVLPSRSDQWGMVLNEGASAGLPLVATEAVGAAHELIEDGVNGFRVATGDAAALAVALRRIATDDAFRIAAGVRSRELAAGFTPAAWARAVAALAREVVS